MTTTHRRPSRLRGPLVAGALVLAALISWSWSASGATAGAMLSPLDLAQAIKANCQQLAAHSTGAQRTRAQQCVTDQQRVIDLLTAPTSSPPASTPPATTPPVSPSGTPTTPPVTASPTPTATTPAPTTPPATTPPATTPPASPTPTPTVGPVGHNCVQLPSACGYPDATNTGVPAGTTLTVHSGNLTVTAAGTVITGMDITGCLDLQANNVTVRNSRIGSAHNCGDYAVRSFGRSGELFEDSDIVMGGYDGKGIAFDGYTVRRVHFYGGADCAHAENNVTIVDSFCELDPHGPASGPHYDGFQSDGGHDITIDHNTVINPYDQNSAILMSTNTAPITNVWMTNNLIQGGGYTAYCGTTEGGLVRGVLVFAGNRIVRGSFWGPAAMCEGAGTGNVWDDTGTSIWS